MKKNWAKEKLPVWITKAQTFNTHQKPPVLQHHTDSSSEESIYHPGDGCENEEEEDISPSPSPAASKDLKQKNRN